MKTFETVDIGDLTIIRQGIEPVLAGDLEAECADFFSQGPGQRSDNRGPQSPEGFYTQRIPGTPDFATMGYEALAQVMEITEKPWVQNFGVNLQKPYSYQRFHPDLYRKDPVQVIHASDGGAFDFVTRQMTKEEELRDHHTVELNAGDIVLQHRSSIRHRGRNLTGNHRYTIVRYS